jgi:hypothetical protein
VSPERLLRTAGTWGAMLTIVILAMTVLLRLSTHLEGGDAVSSLGAQAQQWVRLAHRLAAGGVGILAALALVSGWRDRGRRGAILAIVGLTLALALIGRHSAGYRIDVATVVNVAAGIALAAAFWRLRTAGGRGNAAAWTALGLLIALAALGAATDAAAMRGERAFGPLHLWTAALFSAVAIGAAWQGRTRAWTAASVATLVGAQLVLGFWMLASGGRPLAAGWLHAMIACALALLLVSLAALRPRPAPGAPP